MERERNLFIWSLSLALFFLLASTAWAQIDVGNFTISGAGEVGALPMSRTGKDGKFEEYRDIHEGFIVPELQLMIGGKKEDYYLEFDGLKPGRDDQNFSLRAGRYGLLDVQFEWDQIPHHFDNAQTPFAMNGGRYSLGSRPVLPTTNPAIGNTCAANSVCQWLGQADHPVDLSILDRIARLKIRYTPTPGWTFTGSYWSNHDTGDRAFGALNGNSSSTMNISELAEPIDYQTHNVEFGGEYAAKSWSVALRYNGSFFNNSVNTLTWDNPIHAITGGTTIGSSIFGGTCQDSVTFTPTTGSGPCQGRLSLYPDNQAHTITLTGTATLPLRTRFLATASYGWRLQSERFQPFTINSCYGSGAVPASCADGTLTAMPTISSNNLDGDVRPLMINTTLVNSSLVTGLNLKAFYRLYDLSNHSSRIHIPQGFVLNDTRVDTGQTQAPLMSFSKNTAGLEAGYSFTSWLNGKFNYTFERTHRDEMVKFGELSDIFPTTDSNENTFGPTLDIKPLDWLLFRAKYSHSYRDSDFNPNQNGNRLVAFFLQKREQDKVSLFSDISPFETLGFHAGFEFTGNHYPDMHAFGPLNGTTYYGLIYDRNFSPSVGFVYSPMDWLRFFGDYNWDLTKYSLSQNSTNLRTHGRDTANTFSLGSDVDIIKDLLSFRIQYTFSQGLSEIDNNGNGASVPAVDYPNNFSTWHELLARFNYQIHKNVALRVGYYFNALRENDYGVDIMKQWMGDISSPGDTSAQILSQQRSIFLGDRPKGPFTAHVGFLAVRFSF